MFKMEYDPSNEITLERVWNACEGWCSIGKADAMHRLIKERNIHRIVEIGVYGGKSLLPMAYTCRERGFGTVFGIDPYTTDDAIQTADNDLNERTRAIDFEAVYQRVLANLERFEMSHLCKILKMTSTKAAPLMGDIDLLHIDGNHDEANVTNDIDLYIPKVIPGGVVWFDDLDWPGVKAAIEKELPKGRIKLLAIDGSQWIGEKI